MDKKDNLSLFCEIGNSIAEKQEIIEKLEKKNNNLTIQRKKLKNQIEEKNKVIDEILNYPFFTGECPYSLISDNFIQELCDCDNCQDDYKKCWLKYFKNKILKRGKNGNA